MDKKLVYIAHPISGDVKGNIDKVLAICRDIHLKSGSKIIPYAPYIAALLYLDDNNKEERELGFEANRRLFEKGGFDELWLCGDRVSKGMREEVEWCIRLNIPVVSYSSATVEPYIKYRVSGVWEA
jgi:hypothetical protein